MRPERSIQHTAFVSLEHVSMIVCCRTSCHHASRHVAFHDAVVGHKRMHARTHARTHACCTSMPRRASVQFLNTCHCKIADVSMTRFTSRSRQRTHHRAVRANLNVAVRLPSQHVIMTRQCANIGACNSSNARNLMGLTNVLCDGCNALLEGLP